MTSTTDRPSFCQELAQTLAATATPEAILPPDLPCSPLDLLIALHQEVLRSMLSNLSRAIHAGDAAKLVAVRCPEDALVQAQAHWTQGTAVLYIPDYKRALDHYDAALAWYERACQQLSPDVPARDVRVVQIVRVFCLSELGRYPEAHEAIDAAEAWLL
ncbi:hypothetical protein SE17_13160 [Kouleothrix aurantiaca]|uniref:MalT-like TPR region domain-containing protein n=1 Tax=Kouleothrix aurantiaca TaxID=186479 RepID=A0A0P9DRJ4_9CHLR|nr:hypothetical protein SE17_13160 [Kouleothrix aurantiaca]